MLQNYLRSALQVVIINLRLHDDYVKLVNLVLTKVQFKIVIEGTE
jgi:hypothetical protein